ncbi:universal stress protein [Streptomyces sp. 4.24]|uniref:universal stress protein n=1 Tax=Streptomyces tritrimontium TaxID=3406573 RepID=UPI003BB6ADB5
MIAAVDGSANSNRALEWALSQAPMAGAPLRIVHARLSTDTIGSALSGAFDEPGRDDDPVLGRTGLPPIEYASHPGTPDNVLPGLGEGAQLMVRGSRGRGGFASLLLGSNGLACASRAARPVVVALGLNSAAPDDSTTSFAFREAARRGARLQVVVAHAWPGRTFTTACPIGTAVHEETAARIRPHAERFPKVAVEQVSAPGDAAGHLGSVTNAVLLHTGCPVAVVPLEEDAVPAAA